MVDSDPGPVDPQDLEPAGFAVTLAFVGALVGAAGATIWLLVGEWGRLLFAVGILVILCAPMVWIGLRRGVLHVPSSRR